MQLTGSAVFHFPKAIFEAFRALAQPKQPEKTPLSAEQIAEIEQNLVVYMATETPPEFVPANGRPVASAWENTPEDAIKSLRRKAAENGCEAVYNVIQESRPYYEGGRFFSIYRVYGLM